ncbi:MAG: hypothetical protein ABFD50_19015 [Smithella sp.]
MEQIKIILNAYGNKIETSTVEAEPIKFQGFDDFQFYIHRSYGSSEMLEFGWTITEKSTGLSFIQGHFTTREETIKMAEKKLSQISPEKLKARIEQTIKIYGIVND